MDDYLAQRKRELEFESSQKADELGIPVSNGNWFGHNDPRDAFRHAYSSAILTFEYGSTVAYTAGAVNEWIGALWSQPSYEAGMDTQVNTVGRRIGQNVRSRDEIAQRVYAALAEGKLISDPEAGFSPSNDAMYTFPSGFEAIDADQENVNMQFMPANPDHGGEYLNSASSYVGNTLGELEETLSNFFSGKW
jgi:hypothetical protein